MAREWVMATNGDLVKVEEVKDVLDIDHDGYDGLISDIILRTEADLQSFTGVPIKKTTFTERHDGGTQILFLERWPIDEESITVTDLDDPGDSGDDEALTQDDDYRVDPDKGEIIQISSTGARSGTFGEGVRRFKVEYEAGLALYDTWESYDKRRLAGSVRRLCVARFERRNPELRDRSSGGNVRRTFNRENETGLPREIVEIWSDYQVDVGVGGP